MKDVLTKTISLIILTISIAWVNLGQRTFACELTKNGPLGIPTWYKYLDGEEAKAKLGDKEVTVCKPKLYSVDSEDINSNPNSAGTTLSKNASAIGFAFVEILMRFLIYISIIWAIWGGYEMIVSGGNSQGFKNGIGRIKNALIGLVLGILSTSIVSFVASKLTG
jgi:hypothetical protein